MLITRILPTAADLVALAIAGTDFVSEITGDAGRIRWFAADAIELASEQWEEATGATAGAVVPSDLMNYATDLLIEAGLDILDAADGEAEDARRAAIDAGDMTRDGAPVPYATSRGV
jgi:hypothetical protein